ncbi:MAG: aminotransferase class V-fold PLP-dependent enzyme [Candidatus Hodarchaeales archaeon]|jgi:selenocysteine lyase/cysteine desulfurase
MEADYYSELERGVQRALETYSNVHRGTGHNSLVTTALYEHARGIILEYLNLDVDKFVVIFCSPLRAKIIKKLLHNQQFSVISSREIGLPLGIRAIAVERRILSKFVPFQTGGGMVRMVYPNTAIWADDPDRFEAGTPNIVNAIALAKALKLIKQAKKDIFQVKNGDNSSVDEILYQDAFLYYSGEELRLKLREALVGSDIRVPTMEGERPYVNFDNAASTPTFSPIWETVCQVWKQSDLKHQEIIKEAKKICSEFLNAPLEKFSVIFTSNTTEAINIAIQSLIEASEEGIKPVIVNTMLEHNSNDLPWRYIPNISLVRLEVDDEGFIDIDELEKILREYNYKMKYGKKRIYIVSVSGASNVLGSFNNIARISRITHKYGAKILVDGAQLVAHRKISIVNVNIDFFAFSGHKMYAPFGTGALIIRKGILNPHSVEISKIKSSGEENVIGISSLGKAMVLLRRIGMNVIEEQERLLTRRALLGFNTIKNLRIFGVTDPESQRFYSKGGTFVISMKDVPHNLFAKELAEMGGIGVRNGCFCAHMLVKDMMQIPPLRVLAARLGLMLIPNFTDRLLPGLVRVSFGIENDEREVDYLIQTLIKIANKPRSFINRFIAANYNGIPFLPETETHKKINEFIENSKQNVYG